MTAAFLRSAMSRPYSGFSANSVNASIERRARQNSSIVSR